MLIEIIIHQILLVQDKLFNHFNNPNNNLKFMFVKYDDNDVIEEKKRKL